MFLCLIILFPLRLHKHGRRDETLKFEHTFGSKNIELLIPNRFTCYWLLRSSKINEMHGKNIISVCSRLALLATVYEEK